LSRTRYLEIIPFTLSVDYLAVQIILLEVFMHDVETVLVSPDGVAPSRMVCVSTSVNLPLHHKVQKFSSGTSSPGWSQKKGHKTVMVVETILERNSLSFSLSLALCLVTFITMNYSTCHI